MSVSYNALVDVGRIDPDVSTLTDDLAAHHAVLAATAHGTVEVILTVPADDLRQAAVTALALVTATGAHPQAIAVMATDAFDARHELTPLADEISVNEAAALLGITGSAVRQRLAGGRIAGRRVGRDWRLPRAEIARIAAGTVTTAGDNPARIIPGPSVVHRDTGTMSVDLR
ncbi:MAG: helix-turn-helix domain-containing protein [Cellulomonadaceae bacterium]|nr:helix-turn-helix domain-containing protein [Cellulomonadaceae bacterium]